MNFDIMQYGLNQIKLREKAGQGIDLEAERHQIAQLLDQALKQASLGQRTGFV